MKSIEIADWNSPSQVLQVEDAATVGQVFSALGKNISARQSVKLMNNNQLVGLDEIARDGEVYIVGENHTSGSFVSGN